MEFMIDTANLEEIKRYKEYLPLAGVTTNPSIIKKEGQIDFFMHMKKIREMIGKECSLHIQVVAQDYDGMMKEAETILKTIDKEVFIKVPVTLEGMKVIKALKAKQVHVTATAIYTKFQAYMAIAAGADYIAPYVNRMLNLNIDPQNVITELANEIARTNSKTKIVAASFKNIGQVNMALESGAQAVTIGSDIVKEAFAMPSVQKAVDDFTVDWESIFNKGTKIFDM